MSRIGRNPVKIPQGVKLTHQGQTVLVEGPKGKLSVALNPLIKVQVSPEQATVERLSNDKASRAMHGLFRALLANMVQGVTAGFSKTLEISGVGYRAQMKGKQLSLSVGFSHAVEMDVPEGLKLEVPNQTTIVVSGMDKQQVGQFAADIRQVSPPEPYKGKGIKYAGESIRRKAGKSATGTGSK